MPTFSATVSGEVSAVVITSYSIHYTKLYEATPQFNLLIERYTNITGTKVIPFGNSLDSVNININELLGANYGFWKSQNNAFGTLKEDHIKITAPNYIKIINSGSVNSATSYNFV